ncbi:MAG: protein translocase subunit SecD [Clostridium sp.]|nr:protein translocase subunit SecD [Clostridium sp.]MCM1399110.1 protein translocase subunit SecD [Clostridium sp.]MCM1459502.1 protein translocase subunit SecD [Bacteroides sp.]
MKKARRKAILVLLIFLALLAGGIYMAAYGVGGNEAGKAANIPLGLDLQGGLSVTYRIVTPGASEEQINATVDKLQRRVDTYSSEGEVYPEGDDRITVEVPIKDAEKMDAYAILEELGQPGTLEFLDSENFELWAAGEEYEYVVNGADIKNADAGVDDSGVAQDYVVQLQFTDEGTKKFAKATAENIGKPIYIIYDNQVQSYPTVQTEITDGNAVINGMEDYDRAKQLADTIKIGALPLELEQLQYNIVGAKLGTEAISTSIKAGVIGLGIVCLLMMIIYLVPGFIASIALVAYVVLMLLFLNIRSVVLTLPGLAGIVLSIGMAVDANVIIFTRIKEEIAAGKNVKTAVSSGFSKALSSILDGNITTLIAAFVLMALGTGSIKGFANTLVIGILLSMFTALVITKLLLNVAVNLGITNKKCYGQAKEPKVRNYVKNSKVCFAISAALIILGLVFLPINKSRDGQILNFSLEFTGGASTTVEFTEQYDLARVENEIIPVIVENTGLSAGDIQIQTVEGTNQVIFKTIDLSVDDGNKEDSASATDAAEQNINEGGLEKVIRDNFEVVSVSTSNIGSTISGEMRKDAIVAIIVASILMLIYIAIRFSDVKFGASAVLALIHDVMVVFMLYSVASLSVGNTFIACMLTIVGYSINATIIIFDRIRENMKLMGRDDLENVVNTSISQTFTRTIYTSLTTFVMVLVLFIMGVASLKEFTLTLMAGILCGAYSSVCITGPLWYMLKKKFTKSA